MSGTTSAALLVLLLGCGTSASGAAHRPPPPTPQPTEDISAPPAQPTEVKIISTPPAPPAEVKIVSAPPDESAHAMVQLTRWIVGANAVLCLVTLVIGVLQSRDNKRSIAVSAQAAAAASTSANAADRSANAAGESIAVTRRQERATLEREVNRAAHKVVVTATRLDQLALEVPTVRNHLHVLLHQGGMPPTIKDETERTLQDRRNRMQAMSSAANVFFLAGSDLGAMSDKELTSHLWRLDEHQEQLEAIRDAITHELNKYETESLTIRQQQAALQAAALNATLSKPLKSKLGE